MKRCLAAALLVLPLLGSDSPKQYDDRTEIENLAGTWQVVSVENTGGIYLTADGRMSFHDGKFAWTGRGFLPNGYYTVDAKKKPAWLDMRTTKLPRDKNDWKCVYRIDGDILKIAWPLTSIERSQRFDINGDRRQSVSTFKRVKK